jgi:hypothetical protein
MNYPTSDRACGRSPSSHADERQGTHHLCWNVVETEQALEESLTQVLNFLNPIINTTLNDAALAHVMLMKNLFVDPLSRHEFSVLACALYQELRTGGDGFNYGNIIELTDHFQGRPMNTTMIYKTVVALQEKGLIAGIGKDKSSRGRVADHFVVTSNGRASFRLATSNALHLRSSRESVAA